MRIVIQVRELVASNVTHMVQSSTNPVKMLKLLRSEIEESDIALHGEIGTLQRRRERALASAKKFQAEAAEWSDKAKIAMDHGREDLARSALLAREESNLRAQQSRDEAADLENQIAEAQDALTQLAAKLEETKAKLRDETARHQDSAPGAAAGTAAGSRADSRMDRISTLERRVDHALSESAGSGKSNAAVDAEIAAMRRDSAVEAELEKLRSGGAAKPAKKRKAG